MKTVIRMTARRAARHDLMGTMSHVVIAPDKFKGTLSASEVAAHVAAGLAAARPGTETVAIPVADGGDGTVDAAVAAGYRRVKLGCAGRPGAP